MSIKNDEEIENGEDNGDVDEEVKKLMKDYDLEKDEAEEVKDLMDETGLDEDEAVELKEIL